MAQLLEHTGGVLGSSHADYGRDQPGAAVAQVAAGSARKALAWCPGLHYAYSNEGITLAAAALERAGGADFDTLMQREVFAPLGLQGASFATGEPPACLARSFDAKGRRIEQPWQLAVRPAGALVATPEQLARVVQMALRGGDGFLTAASLSRMASGQTGLAGRAGAADGAYGLGLFRFAAGGRLWHGHWGRIDGFQTSIGWDPDAGRGFVLMVNAADRRGMQQLREAVTAHLAVEMPPRVPPPSSKVIATLDGWYANASHDMALRAPWVALWDVKRLRADGDGVRIDTPWLPGSATRYVATGPQAFRDPALFVPSAAWAQTPDGQRWWINGGSYRAVQPGWALSQLGVVATGLFTALGLMLASPWLLLHAWRGSVASAALWLSALAYAGLAGGYVAWGLFGEGDVLGNLGRVSPHALFLLTCSVLGPGSALLALWRGSGWARWLALPLVALGALCMAYGWVPLSTWTT